MPVLVAVPPTQVPGSPGLKMIQAEGSVYLYYVDAFGNPTGSYGMQFQAVSGGIRAIRVGNPGPEFLRDVDDKIVVVP